MMNDELLIINDGGCWLTKILKLLGGGDLVFWVVGPDCLW